MRVGENEPVMMTELAARLGIDKSQASRAVSRMAQTGLVRRVTARGEIKLSPRGRRLYERGLPLMLARHRRVMAGASNAQLRTFAKAFPKLLENAKAMLVQEQALLQSGAKPDPLQNARYLFPWTENLRPIPMLSGLYGMIRKSGDYTYKRALGLSDFEWRVLSLTGAGGEISLMQLVNELDRDKSQVGRTIKHLVEIGFCKTSRIGSSRNVVVSLTSKGKRAYDQLEFVALERHRALTNGLTARELALLDAALVQFENNAEQMLAEEISRAEAAREDFL